MLLGFSGSPWALLGIPVFLGVLMFLAWIFEKADGTHHWPFGSLDATSDPDDPDYDWDGG
jgi:hypothetical protein